MNWAQSKRAKSVWSAEISLFLLQCANTVASSRPIVVDNVEPRRALDNTIVNAHDGALYHFEGKWVLIGTSYQECEGFTNCSSHIGDCGWQNNNFSVYTADAVDGPWALESGNILPNRSPLGANFRPKLLFDHSSSTYVLWYNYQTPTPNIPGYYNVATSKHYAGPYTIIKENATVSKPLNGDFNLFVDDDDERTAYIIYNSDQSGGDCPACHIPPCDCGFQMSIERLNPGYTSSSLQNSGWIGASPVEAPAMFKRGNIYYALFDRLSCFGPQGSGAVVYTATAPMGPYKVQNNINRYGPYRRSQLGFIIVAAQQTYVAEINGTYVWQGDLWDSYTDANGRNVKAYDYQVWLPLEFNEDGNISQLVWRDSWVL